VRYLFRTTSEPNRIHAVFVDLCARGVSAHVTRPDDRGLRTSTFASRYGVQIAVNAGFYNTSNYAPIGLTMGEGELWTDSGDSSTYGFVAFGERNQAELSTPSTVVSSPADWMTDIVAGYPLLVDNGQVIQEACFSHMCERHPRTAVGFDATGRTAILVVVDGRWSGVSRGMTRLELAALMVDLGAVRALNLDGGGSSTLYVAGLGGVVNHPSDGSERVVSNHLGFTAGGSTDFAHCCIPAAVPGATGVFADLPDNHWARGAAETLFELGISNGCQAAPRLFCPSCLVTRGQAARLMAGGLGLPDLRPATPTFTDVPASHGFYGAIEALYADGYITGCSASPMRFCPDDDLTRAQAAVLATRLIGADGLSVSPPTFSDCPAGAWYTPFVERVNDSCIASGCDPSAGLFCPTDPTTRAEFAMFLVKSLELGDFANCYGGGCQPSCAGRACGSDGCGGCCGTCGANESCTNGACVPLCVPSCGGRVCGDNGCGGSCGTCGMDQVCTDGVCAQPTLLVDWCRFQWPRLATVEVGGLHAVYGRVFEAGITDRTAGPDADPSLVVAAGVGPVGVQPGSGAFTWSDAVPNPAWNDAQEPGNDEYVAALTVPAEPGEYDLAFRATVDGGAHWLYCDLQTPAGDGSSDGWQSANAARVMAVCVPDCGERECGPDGCGGVCGPCGADETCEEGVCRGATDPADWCRLQWPLAQQLAPGQVFTAYVRIYEAGVTTRTDAVDTDAAVVVAAGIGPDGSEPVAATWAAWTTAVPNPAWDAAAAFEPNNDEYMVQLEAPGAAGVYDYAFRASADGGATWTYCDANGGYGHDGSEDGYQPGNAGALTVVCQPDCYERECGDDDCGGSCGACGPDEACEDGQCVTTCTPDCDGRDCGDDGCGDVCGECVGDETCMDGECVGCQPDCDGRECGDDGCDGDCGPCGAGEGCADGQCVALPAFGWCRLQWVSATTATPGASLTAYVRVHVEGVTDRTAGTDTTERLAVAVGVGPNDIPPADVTFVWTAAAANETWVDTGEPNNDEYQATLVAPQTPGAYDVVGSVTLDGAATIHCDTDGGFGHDGSEDGYQADRAWLLTVE